jgi:hypothetical protein
LQIKNRCQKLLFFKKFNEAVVKISARSEKLLAFVVKGLNISGQPGLWESKLFFIYENLCFSRHKYSGQTSLTNPRE